MENTILDMQPKSVAAKSAQAILETHPTAHAPANPPPKLLDQWLSKLQRNLQFLNRSALESFLGRQGPEHQSWIMERYELPLELVFDYLSYVRSVTPQVSEKKDRRYLTTLDRAVNKSHAPKQPTTEQWVCCSERFPEKDEQKVVVLSPFTTNPPGIFLAKFVANPRKWLISESGIEFSHDDGVITHWMVLPELPKVAQARA